MAGRGVRERLSLVEVEHVAFALAEKLLRLDEPIPDFSTRFPGILESCLGTPFQTFGGRALYPSLVARASILFYLIVKNHPFQNGNKRIAVTTLLYFLFKHGKWLNVDLPQFLNVTRWVAQSRSKEKDCVILAIEAFVSKHLAPLSG